MEKKTPDETLSSFLAIYPDSEKYDAALTAIQAYATQETKPLQERIDELEGALRAAKIELEMYIPVTDVEVLRKITKALNTNQQ